MISEIMVDADGVVVDFDLKIQDITGSRPHQMKKGKMWAAVRRYIVGGGRFWYDMEPMADSQILMDHLKSLGIPFKILTAGGDEPSAELDKIEWFALRYPGVEVVVVHKSGDKAAYASPSTVLIDDREKSITPWEAAGGIGILHKSAEDTIRQLTDILKRA